MLRTHSGRWAGSLPVARVCHRLRQEHGGRRKVTAGWGAAAAASRGTAAKATSTGGPAPGRHQGRHAQGTSKRDQALRTRPARSFQEVGCRHAEPGGGAQHRQDGSRDDVRMNAHPEARAGDTGAGRPPRSRARRRPPLGRASAPHRSRAAGAGRGRRSWRRWGRCPCRAGAAAARPPRSSSSMPCTAPPTSKRWWPA